jgi:hypothetical protein
VNEDFLCAWPWPGGGVRPDVVQPRVEHSLALAITVSWVDDGEGYSLLVALVVLHNLFQYNEARAQIVSVYIRDRLLHK